MRLISLSANTTHLHILQRLLLRLGEEHVDVDRGGEAQDGVEDEVAAVLETRRQCVRQL